MYVLHNLKKSRYSILSLSNLLYFNPIRCFILNTLCEHIALQISLHTKKYETLVTGGGALNRYLVNRIKFHSSSKIIIPNKKIIEFKEALIFAFLGVLKTRNEINCLKSVTGASRNSSTGDIHLN